MSESGIKLSAKQQQTVAAGITVLCATFIIGFLVGLLWLLVRFLDFFSGVFFPLVAALILALVFKPQYDFFNVRLKLPPALAITALYLSLLVPVSIFSYLFGAEVYSQTVTFVGDLPQILQSFTEEVQAKWPDLMEVANRYGIKEKLAGSVEGQGSVIARALQQATNQIVSTFSNLMGFVSSILGLAILPVYLAFLLMIPKFSVNGLNCQLPFLKEKTREDIVYLVDQFLQIMVTFFRGQILIAFIQGVLFSIGFGFAGLKYGFVIGFALGLLNIVPYLGSMVGLAIALPTAYLQADGGLGLLAIVVIVFIVVQCIEGYVLTPKIMGDRTGLHPGVIMFAIFFWGTALSGIAGMILAIPFTAFIVVFWRLARERYIQEIV